MKVVSPSHSENLVACLAYPGSHIKSSVPSVLISSPSGKLLIEAPFLAQAACRCPLPAPCWYFDMAELDTLDLHKHLIAELFSWRKWLSNLITSHEVSKFLVYPSCCCLFCILRGEGLLVCVFFGGGHACGEANSKCQDISDFFVTHYLTSAGNPEVKLKWSVNFIFREENLLYPLGDIKCL